MLRHVQTGDHPSASQWNEMLDVLQASGITGPGISKIGGRQQFVERATKQPAKFAFVVGINQTTKMVKVRDATWLPDEGLGWLVSSGDENVIERPPAPGLTIEDFRPFIAANDPPELTDPAITIIDDACWLPSGGPASTGQWGGKIIAVNLHAQIAFVAPIVPAPIPNEEHPEEPDIVPESIDPTDTAAWSNPDNFDLSQGRCVWIRGYTGYLVNQSVTVVDVRGSTLPWATNIWNLTGKNFQAWCTPRGPFAPQRELGCDPPDDSPLCDTGACCLPQDCFSTTERACASQEGEFYPGQSCDELFKSGICRPEFPCCLPDGVCQLLSASECETAAGLFFPDEASCVSVECPDNVACCFPDGTCGEMLETTCRDAGGTPIDDCGNCRATIGCCIEYEWVDASLRTRQCIGNINLEDCDARSWCLSGETCGWTQDDCSESVDCT